MLGWTAPTNVLPWSVISTETRLVRSSRPVPQAPCTGVAEASRAFSTAALSPAGLAEEPGPGAGALGVSADDGNLSTVSQPDPISETPEFAPLVAPLPPPARLTWVTVDPGGGVKLRSAGAGVTNWMAVYPTWKAGLLAPRAKTCSRSGTPLRPSTSIWTWPTSDRASLGASTRP